MRIAIIGGGPAGAFCAIQISKLAGKGRHEITIYDRKLFSRFGPPGCNLGAGVIARSMIEDLRRHDIRIPPHVKQREIKGFSFYTEGGERHFLFPEEKAFYSVFRGGGPRDKLTGEDESFDHAVLENAVSLGVRRVEVGIGDIEFPDGKGKPFRLTGTHGEEFSADLVVGAFGVNSALGRVIEGKNIGYRAPQCTVAFQAEVHLDEDFIESSFGGCIKVLSYRIPGVRFISLTPKKDYITITVIGRRLAGVNLKRLLRDVRMLEHFPEDFVLPGAYCSCQPRLPIAPARHPYSDRFVVIGDAHVSRYYKNGIGSAFMTATFAAESIAAGDVSSSGFQSHYHRKCADMYYLDNRYGKLMFLINDFVSKSPFFSSVFLNTAESTTILSPSGGNVMDEVLIDLFTGESPYSEIFLKALNPRLQVELFKNIALEIGSKIVG